MKWVPLARFGFIIRQRGATTSRKFFRRLLDPGAPRKFKNKQVLLHVTNVPPHVKKRIFAYINIHIYKKNLPCISFTRVTNVERHPSGIGLSSKTFLGFPVQDLQKLPFQNLHLGNLLSMLKIHLYTRGPYAPFPWNHDKIKTI